MKPTVLIGGVLAIVLFALSGADGAEWVYVMTQGDGSTVYVDHESITILSRHTVMVSVKLVCSDKKRSEYTATLGKDYSDLAISIDLLEYNCATQEYRLASITQYDSQDKVIYEQTRKDGKWDFIRPSSVGEAIFNVVCPRKGKELPILAMNGAYLP